MVRAMPNTPCAIGCGMTGLAKGIHAAKEHLEIAQAMFEAVGRVVVVDEKQIDAVTGLSASGTAFIYIILESLAEGGVKVGLPRDVSTLLAAQTMMGAARMVLDTGDHPALLKDAVTTPAGSTMDGILELEDGKAARDLDQGRDESHAARQGIDRRILILGSAATLGCAGFASRHLSPRASDVGHKSRTAKSGCATGICSSNHFFRGQHNWF